MSTEPRDLGTPLKVAYGVGSLAFGIKDSGFRLLLLIYYNQVIGLPAVKVAFAIMVALVVDAFLDPVIGEISDNWRSRWGRRHPFMYAAALPSALSFLAVWFPPTGWSQDALLAYLIGAAVVVRACLTIYEIPSSALVAELTTDYDQRTSLMSWRYLFFFGGGGLLTLITYRVFLKPTAAYPIGQLNPNGYHHYALAAASVILVTILASALGTHRQIPNLKAAPPKVSRSPIAVIAAMAKTVANRSFLMVAGAGLCKSMSLGISGALAIYMNTYFWRLTSAQIGILTIDGLFAAAIAFWMTPRLGVRFSKRNLCLVFYAGSFLVACWPTVVKLAGWGLQVGSPWIVPVLFINSTLFGAMGISATILATSMIADVVEDSQRETGRRSEGLFFAASSLIGKAVSGVGVFGSGMLLAFVNFPEKARPDQVDPALVDKLALSYLPVAGALYAIGVVLMLNYRIDRKSHAANLVAVGEAEAAEAIP